MHTKIALSFALIGCCRHFLHLVAEETLQKTYKHPCYYLKMQLKQCRKSY